MRGKKTWRSKRSKSNGSPCNLPSLSRQLWRHSKPQLVNRIWLSSSRKPGGADLLRPRKHGSKRPQSEGADVVYGTRSRRGSAQRDRASHAENRALLDWKSAHHEGSGEACSCRRILCSGHDFGG